MDRRTRPPLLTLVVAMTALAIGAGALLQATASNPSPSMPAAAAGGGDAGTGKDRATATSGGAIGSLMPPGPADTSAGSPPEGAWAPVDLPAFDPAVRLVPTSSDASGVATDAAFRLTSTGPVPARVLAASLVTSPALAVSSRANPDGSVTIRPAKRLVPGAVYRFEARAPDGSLVGSWSFQAAAPLGVASTIPGDRQSGVPLDTGIEITFDQDGVTGAAGHVAIAPAVKGSFEQHGRTLVFVPTKKLAPRTLYTVTVSRGVGIAGSDEILERDAAFAFETGDPDSKYGYPERFERTVTEAATGSPPTLLLVGTGSARQVTLDVYRYPSLDAAAAAARALAKRPAWTEWTLGPRLQTTGLTPVLRATLTPVAIAGDQSGSRCLTLPRPLPAGYYLVEMREGSRSQAVLQVTDLATYALFSEADSLFWVNDLATGHAVEGASVDVLGGAQVGTTDGAGLVRAPLPAGAQAAAEIGRVATLVVRAPDGRAAFLTLGGEPRWDVFDPLGPERTDVADAWWHVFSIDRTVFRTNDTVTAWGYLRPRDGGPPPRSAELSLLSDVAGDGGDETPPVATATVRPEATGAFVARLAIEDLPLATYELQLRVGATVVDRTWLRVGVVAKPSFKIDLSTDRHVYVEGDPIRLTVGAAFFDGTPVPSADVRVSGWTAEIVRTGPDGGATATQVPTLESYQRSGIQSSGITATLVGAEEGWISATASPVVLPSRRWLTATATTTGTGAVVSGILSAADVERLERDWKSVDWDTDAAGAPIPGGEVAYELIAEVPVVTRTEVTYDFLEKRVVRTPIWESHERTVRTGTVRSDTAGRFRIALSLPAAGGYPTTSYRVRLSTSDAGGHVYATTVYLRESDYRMPSPQTPDISEDPACEGLDGPCVYAVGEPVVRSMSDEDGPLPSGGTNRYLWATLQRGLRDVAVGSSSTYRAAFETADVPNVQLTGVRFTGSRYAVSYPVTLAFDSSSRRLDIRLTTDRDRYAPGDRVRLSVRTLDPTGRPVAASVAVRVIDEKLYASSQAYEDDPLALLYGWVPSGLLASYASHPAPVGRFGGGGKGDTTGGGERDDFRDFLDARLVTTDAAGRGTMTFTLSDDLTSWRVTASGLTAGLQAGTASTLVPAGLPFFVDAPVAPEYLVGERPTLRLRAFGSALATGDRVTFSVTSTTLRGVATTVEGAAFEPVDVELPALPAGRQSVRIAASGPSGAGKPTPGDIVVRTFDVVESRFVATRTTFEALTAGAHTEGGAWTSYVFTDAGRGRYLSALLALASSTGQRVDASLAAVIARDLLAKTFGVPDTDLPRTAFDPARYQHGQLIGLVPYGGEDLSLTARVALLAPDRFDGTAMRGAFEEVLADATRPREARSFALAGLAGLGARVDGLIRAALGEPSLTVRERLVLALGAAELGDTATALAVERDLLRSSGEQLGLMIRLRVGTARDDTIEATGLLAVIAATIGDPVAVGAEAYLESQPGTDVLASLERAVAIARLVERTASAPARFAYRVAGQRRVVELAPGKTYTLHLTASQRATLSLEPLRGSVGVATTWREPVAPAAAATDPSLSLTRSVTPAGDIPAAAVVEIVLTATFGPQALAGQYELTELVPSGLAPLPLMQMWTADEDSGHIGCPGSSSGGCILPYAIDGQRVSFAASRPGTGDAVYFRYLARVVTPGRYVWEPARLAAVEAPESAAIGPQRSVVVR